MQQESAPGFFGKVPARGDFLARRVPPPIAASWESWLQALTVAVRESGERGWQDAWLTAPLWHFVIGRGLAPPHGAAGILVASADRVGRLFPFTLIGAGSPAAADEAGHWSQAAEQLALGALEDDFDPAGLDESLARLGPPQAAYGPNRPTGQWPLALADGWPARGDPFAEDESAQMGPGPDQSEWWTRGSDRIAPVRLRCNGLPARPIAAAMLLGGLTETT